MASVVLQGLFPLTVDSPVMQPINSTVESDWETDDEVGILGHVTSTVAEGLVKLIVTFDSADRQLQSNKTDGRTSEYLSYFAGRYLITIRYDRPMLYFVNTYSSYYFRALIHRWTTPLE